MARTTFSGPVKSDNGFEGTLTPPAYTVATVPAEAPLNTLIYVSNGAGGSPCLAIWNGTSWLRILIGAAVAAS